MTGRRAGSAAIKVDDDLHDETSGPTTSRRSWPSKNPMLWGDEDRRLQLSPALTAPRLRTLHRAEDLGSALKGGGNVCQRQLVNESARAPCYGVRSQFSP